MEVIKTHHIDKSEKDDKGFYEYYYEYDMYEFKEEDTLYRVRSYVDTPEEAHFLRKDVNGTRKSLTTSDFNTPFFKSTILYLKAEGKTKFKYLGGKSGGYEPIPQI
jgi:hypothetical protein